RELFICGAPPIFMGLRLGLPASGIAPSFSGFLVNIDAQPPTSPRRRQSNTNSHAGHSRPSPCSSSPLCELTACAWSSAERGGSFSCSTCQSGSRHVGSLGHNPSPRPCDRARRRCGGDPRDGALRTFGGSHLHSPGWPAVASAL